MTIKSQKKVGLCFLDEGQNQQEPPKDMLERRGNFEENIVTKEFSIILD